ncbi:hypothetical protein [Catellatospora tritici]|uniref:hypothetical protein n=1 Tax=Catellatospora tritici TaxID=2851566 RepID=UPI001C2D88C2|nr:hypothetical protein [Catellatospora tritici]MBV1856707.1 hypothetical protein [Catellatospora tritici]
MDFPAPGSPRISRRRFTGQADEDLAAFFLDQQRAWPMARLVRLATLPAADLTNGAHYESDKAKQATRPAAHTDDPAAAATLWEASAKAVGLVRTVARTSVRTRRASSMPLCAEARAAVRQYAYRGLAANTSCRMST